MSKIFGNEIDYLLAELERTSVVVSTVKDGYFLLFKRAAMQKIIDDHPENEALSIFVKTNKPVGN